MFRSNVLNIAYNCTQRLVQFYESVFSTVCFTVLMLLAIVTDTFVLQMLKQVLRNDTFNIAGWS